MNYKFCCTLLNLVVLVFLQICLIPETSSNPNFKFAGWAKPCKLPTDDPYDFVKPEHECDTSKGIFCQSFKEGSLCGCQIGASLTFDRKSGECRRKVMSLCHLAASPQEYNKLSFNRKCHEDAVCTKLNETFDPKRPPPPFACLCKEGFLHLPDFSACYDPNRASTIFTSYFSLVCLFIPFGITVAYYGS